MNQFYEECRDCRHAQFIDFETLKCGKAAPFIPDTYCEEFEEIKRTPNNHNTLGAAEEVVKKIEKEKEQIKKQHIEILKKQKITEPVEIPAVDLGGKNFDNIDRRAHTIKEVNVYNSTDTKPANIIRTIPKNQLISFKREVIRKGQNLLLLKEPNGKKAYIRIRKAELTICSHLYVKENPLDILMMPHEEYDKIKDKIELQSFKINDDYKDHIHNVIGVEKGKTFVRTKDIFKESGKDQEFSAINILNFNTQISSNLELGRLQPHSKLFILDAGNEKFPKKIKLADGSEGILLSKFETYTRVESGIESFVNTLSIIIAIGSIIFGIGFIWYRTGYIFFWGLLFMPIAYFIILIFGVPLYALIDQIWKRL